MTCPRCTADPRPKEFGEGGSARSCAFDEAGVFTDRNWNCATITALIDLSGDWMQEVYGADETMQIIPFYEDCDGLGWIVLTRYKRRGKTSSAVYVGDFWPHEPLTYSRAERAVHGLEEMRAYVARRDASR